MKKKQGLTVELSGYILLFSIALLFRLVNLYLTPLADSEALLALQAENIVTSSGVLKISPDQPLLVNFLVLAFSIFGVQTFMVRLLPAVAGALLVFLPTIFRKQIGKGVALLFAVWLSFDPLFYLLSRKVDSTLLSIGFLVLAFYFLREKKWIGLGIVLALGALTGAQFVIGLILFTLSSLLSKNIRFSIAQAEPFTIAWRATLTAFAAALLLVGTLGFMVPSQFGAVFSGVVNLLTAYPGGPVLTVSNVMGGLFFYELLVVVLGGIGLVVFWKHNPKTGNFLGIWIGLSLLFILFYPARTVALLVWLILPLGYTMIWWLLRVVRLERETRKLTALFSAVLFVFLVYIFMLTFSVSMSGVQVAGIEINSSVIGAISLIIFILAVVMIAWAWSWPVARQSLLIALSLSFIFMNLSAAWNLGGGRIPYHNELWHVGLLSPDTDLMLNSIDALTAMNGGSKGEVEVYLEDIDSPALVWALRDYQLRLLPVLPDALDTDVIITVDQTNNEVYGPYRGQDYLLTSTAAWDLMTTREWKNWVLIRSAPQDGIRQQPIIMWFNNQWFAQNSN